MTDQKLNKDALKILRRKAMAEDPAALSLMGDFHLAGNQDGLRQDTKRALRYFRRAAEGGVVDAHVKAAKILIGLVEAGDQSAPPLDRYIDAAGYAHRAAIAGNSEGWTLLETICKTMTLPPQDGAAQRTFGDAASGEAAEPAVRAAAEGVARDIRRLLDNRRGGRPRAAQGATGRTRTSDIQ